MTTTQTNTRKTSRTIQIFVASVIALGAGLMAAPASAENFNPRAFLFGGAVKMQEGRSAYASASSHRALNQSTIAQSTKQPAELRGTIAPAAADKMQRTDEVKLAGAL